MTKYEWDKELKKNISRLPSAEVAKILDYYNELFEDKVESGMSENAIIREFGNPFDVAYKIITEFESLDDDGANENTAAGQKSKAETKEGYSMTFSSYEGKDNEPVIKEIRKTENSKTARKEEKNSANEKPAEPETKLQSFLKRILLSLPKLLACVSIWFVTIITSIICVSLFIAGLAGVIMAFVGMAQSVGSGIAQIGISLFSIGLGCILSYPVAKLIKKCARYANSRKKGKQETETEGN